MADLETISVYDQKAAEYAEFVQQEEPHPSLLAFISQLNPSDYVLDLGCGPAHASATMYAQGLRVDPVDASAQMVELANQLFDIGARQAQFADISGQDIYEGVWANFSLLHASTDDFPLILRALRHALKPGGLLHLGMKTGDGSARDHLQRLYSYYSESQLRQLLSDNGYEVDSVVQGEDMGLAGDVEPWIVLLCRSTKAHSA